MIRRDIFEEDDGVLAFRGHKQMTEIRRTSRQHQTMRFKSHVFRCQGNICKLFLLKSLKFKISEFQSPDADQAIKLSRVV